MRQKLDIIVELWNTKIMLIGIIILLISLVFFFLGYKKGSQSGIFASYVAVDNIKTIPVGIPVMVSGTVISQDQLMSPITQTPCVYYKYSIEQEVEQKDQNGNITRNWQLVGSPEEKRIPFELHDNNGALTIKPENAQIDAPITTERFLNPGSIGTLQQNPSSFASIATQLISAATHTQERVKESIIPLQTTLNVFGIMAMDGTSPFLQGTKQYPMVITNKSKEQLVSAVKWQGYVLYIIGGLIFAFSLYLLLLKH